MEVILFFRVFLKIFRLFKVELVLRIFVKCFNFLIKLFVCVFSNKLMIGEGLE